MRPTDTATVANAGKLKKDGSGDLAMTMSERGAAFLDARAAFAEATRKGHEVHPCPDVAAAVKAWDAANDALPWYRQPLNHCADETKKVFAALKAYRKELEKKNKKRE